MGSSAEFYYRKVLSGLSKESSNSSDDDPASFAVTLDDSNGHVSVEAIRFAPDHALIGRASSTGYRAQWRDDDNFTFVFQCAGRYDVRITDADYGMSPGSLLAFRPGERRSRIRTDKFGLRNAVTLQVPTALMSRLAQSMGTTSDKIIPIDGTPLPGKVGHTFRRLLPQLADDLMLNPNELPPPRVVLAIKQLIEDVLCEMIGQTAEQRSWRRVFPAFHRVKQAEEFMRANSDESLSMQDIA